MSAASAAGSPALLWEVEGGEGMQTRTLGKSNLEVSAGKIDEKTTFDSSDFRNIVPRFTSENRKANLAFVDWLTKFAERKKTTPAQLALGWLLAQKPWIVPILGTTKRHRLEENFGAAAIHLTSDDGTAGLETGRALGVR